jgi:DNA-binding transcriptional LysR family regulator
VASDPLQIFKIFLRLAQHRSFSKVAELENVHVSSISRRIEMLETQLGVRLFNRTTRSVSLTPPGRAYMQRVEALLAGFDEAKVQADTASAQLAGPLRIAAPVSFARLYLAPLLTKFSQQYPAIEMTLLTGNEISDLIEEEFDLGVRIGGLRSSTLTVRRLARVTRVLCASPRYLEAHGVPRKPADLKAHRCLVADYGRGGPRWYFRKGRGQSDAKPGAVNVSGPLRSNQGDVIVRAAQDGLGVALLPSWLVRNELANGSLVNILDSFRWDFAASRESHIQVVFPARKTLSNRARAFIDFLVPELAEV